jgi:GT2 family glycosyltransferase
MLSPLFRLSERLRSRFRPDRRVARDYAAWLAREDVAGGVVDGPLISVVLPVFDTDEVFLREAIGSVRAQTYKNWQLCVVDDASPSPLVAPVLAELAGLDSRIEVSRLAENAGIAAATNAGFAMARGDFVALLDHDDVLAQGALACVAEEIAENADLAVIFSDEDQLVEGRRCSPYFKPGWNPDLMMAQNVVSHLGVYRRALIAEIGGMREGFEGSQDYDLALRATAAVSAAQIRHIPKPLYHWRQHGESYSAQHLAACQRAARAALADRLGEETSIEADPRLPQWARVVYRLPEPLPLVSIVFSEAAAAPVDGGYDRVETVFGDAALGKGDILLFLSANLVAVCDGWLRELASQAWRPEIGAAGGRLERPDGRIFDTGLTLDPDDIVQTLSPGSDRDDPGYFGQFQLARSVAALSGDCLAIRASLFRELGGFDLRAGAYQSTDFCLRLAERGLRCVWTPQARLRYRTAPRRAADAAGARFMRSRWGEMLMRDPYKNPNLVIRHGNLALAGTKTASRKRLFWS